MRTLMFTLVFMAGCGGEEEGDEAIVEATPCERLREHLINIRLEGSTHIDQTSHRTAMRKALGNEFLASCAKLGSAEVACALSASDSPSAVACTTLESN